MPDLNYGQINDDVLNAMRKPGFAFYLAVVCLGGLAGLGALALMYQTQAGMGVTGLNRPVGWAIYITNFVFWVGIAHSGTLISAILYLLRAKWRDAVSRSAEAMTIFAVMTAGLFPLIHLGRLWAVYYIIPYPSQRQLWPNFVSPLVWDVLAVTTYLTVSLIFWFIGMIPDLAAARDRYRAELGPEHLKSRIYRAIALGWSGSGNQWHHYGRSYLFFAALATPLVVSVHSVVSWDFAMSLLPGWHSAIFPPYFVAGAIHSGLAMVLTLLIPMRKLLHLERIIEMHHFEMLAKTIVLTATIVGYAYGVEAFVAWYSGDLIEWQNHKWRMFGPVGWMYWLCVVCNVLIPWLFVFRRLRTRFLPLFVISLLVNVGMWYERLMIIYTGLAHDFLPHNFGRYLPTWVELAITLGSFGFFFLFFVLFTRGLPTIPLSEIKGQVAEEEIPTITPCEHRVGHKLPQHLPTVLVLFSNAGSLVRAARSCCEAGFTVMETFSPVKIEQLPEVLNLKKSPVRVFTLVGALCGLAGGFWLAGGTALVNSLIVGGKPPLSWVPFCVVAFEGTILLGSLGNLLGLVLLSRLVRQEPEPYYDPRFSRDKFGLLVSCTPEQVGLLQERLAPAGPEEFHVHQ